MSQEAYKSQNNEINSTFQVQQLQSIKSCSVINCHMVRGPQEQQKQLTQIKKHSNTKLAAKVSPKSAAKYSTLTAVIIF
jgi:hypothetical protein